MKISLKHITTLGAILFSGQSISIELPNNFHTTQPFSSKNHVLNLDYDFSGAVSLSNCSGSLVKFDDSYGDDKALILTNGHCVRLIRSGTALQSEPSERKFSILSSSANIIGVVKANKLVYATMTDSDLALYELEETYHDIYYDFYIEPLILEREKADIGTEIEIISGYWKEGYRCEIDHDVPILKESFWTWKESIRYSKTGCITKGGVSGSPIIDVDTRAVVGIHNTKNESGYKCNLNNPCEAEEDNDILFRKDYGYGQQISWLYDCRTETGEFDFTLEGCQLPKPAAALAETEDFLYLAERGS